MNALIRQTVGVLILVPLAVCIFAFRFACDSTDIRRIMREHRLNEELEQSRRITFRRLDAREETVRELTAQRCSLSQALARFQQLDDEWPDHLREHSRTHGRKWSDAEKNYQYILALAKEFLKDRPQEATAALSRLEKDYQQFRTGLRTPLDAPGERAELSRISEKSCR